MRFRQRLRLCRCGLQRAAAKLGIKITHSAPGRPQGRDKIERFFGVVRQEFLVEIGDGDGITGLAELNKLFTAWYETVYHTRSHGETGQPPVQRWLAGAPFPTPSPAQLREAFLWAEYRMVRKDATIKLFGGAYETDPALAGRKVECVFDPFDLSVVEVRWNGRPWGLATPAAHRPAFPSQGQAGRSRRAAARPGSTTWASSPPSMSRPPGATASATTLSPMGSRRPGRAGRQDGQ